MQCTRAENQATPKAAFGFRRDNGQTVCEADGKARSAGLRAHEKFTCVLSLIHYTKISWFLQFTQRGNMLWKTQALI